MKHTNLVVVGAVVAIAFGVGHLTAQPAHMTAPPPAPVMDPEIEGFKGDLGAALKFNNQTKVLQMMNQATGDSKLTGAFVQKVWDYDYNLNTGKQEPGNDRRAVLQSTFLMKQQQRQIELLTQILAEMKKSNAGKP